MSFAEARRRVELGYRNIIRGAERRLRIDAYKATIAATARRVVREEYGAVGDTALAGGAPKHGWRPPGVVVADDDALPASAVDFKHYRTINFRKGLTATDDGDRVDIDAAGGFGPFCYDYLIDEAFAAVVTAGTYSEGDTFTAFHGHTFLIYSTIDGAMAHAAALSSASPRSFFICAGTYTEAVGRTPPAGSPWTIHGIRRRTLWKTTGGFCHAVAALSGTTALHYRGISFEVVSGTGSAITNSVPNFLGSVADCDFDGGNANSAGIKLSKTSGILQVSNCLFEGSGHGISGSSATQASVQVTSCWFVGRFGVHPQKGIRWVITGNFFTTSEMDIIEDGEVDAEIVIVGNYLGTGVNFAGATSIQNLVISSNVFSKTGAVTLLDLGAFGSTSAGITITSNTFLGDSSTTGIDLTDADIGAGLCSNNTFVGFASGSEIVTTGIGSSFQIFHNVSDAGALADINSPVGHINVVGDLPDHTHTADSTDGGLMTTLQDADGDTRIQVEESADEDIIRFDALGTELMTIGDDGAVDISHIAGAADEHALELDVDAAGIGDVKAVDIIYETGPISAGEDEAVIFVDINETDATGGEVYGLEVLATDGSAGAIWGMKAGAVVGPILQDSGVFINPTLATNDTASTDVPDMRDGSVLTNTTIFVLDNDYIIIGNVAAFTELEFIIETPAGNPGIKPTFEYSTAGTGQWTAFTPIDGTNGFRNTGVVAWDAADLTGHVADDVTGTFDIRITRTHANKGNVSLFYAKSAATIVYKWDPNGDLLTRFNYQREQAAAGALTAGLGHYWVKDDSPNIPMFTDDDDVDHELLTPVTTKYLFYIPLGMVEDGSPVTP